MKSSPSYTATFLISLGLFILVLMSTMPLYGQPLAENSYSGLSDAAPALVKSTGMDAMIQTRSDPVSDVETRGLEPVAEAADNGLEMVVPVAEATDNGLEMVVPVAEATDNSLEMVVPVAEAADNGLEMVVPVAEHFTIATHPDRTSLELDLELGQNSMLSLNIYTLNGELVQENSLELGSGKHNLSEDVKSLETDVYLVELVRDNEVLSREFFLR